MSKGTGVGSAGKPKIKKTSMIAARVTPAIKAKLLASAKRDGRTVSLQIVFAIKELLKKSK